MWWKEKKKERDGGEEKGNVGIGEVRELMGVEGAWTSAANHYLRWHSRDGDRQVPGEVNKGGYSIAQ